MLDTSLHELAIRLAIRLAIVKRRQTTAQLETLVPAVLDKAFRGEL